MLATLSPKGQIVLPVAMRRRLHLNPGSTVDIEERAEGVFIRPAGPRPLPPAKGPGADLLRQIDAGEFGVGVDWVRVKAAVARRARSRDLR